MARISSLTKDRFKKSIRSVLKKLSRKVMIYKQPIKQECTNCYFDKFTGKSTGKCKWTVDEAEQKQADWIVSHPGQIRYKWFKVGRCPICHGEGYIEIKRKAWIDCLVSWNPNSLYTNSTVYTPAGSEGSTSVQLKTDPKYYDIFKNCVSSPPTLRGLGNQSVLVIMAFTTEKLKVDSEEIVKDYS
jgi:hypothetical protein